MAATRDEESTGKERNSELKLDNYKWRWMMAHQWCGKLGVPNIHIKQRSSQSQNSFIIALITVVKWDFSTFSEWEYMFTLNLCKLRHCVRNASRATRNNFGSIPPESAIPSLNSAYWPVPAPIVTLAIIILVTLGPFEPQNDRPWHRAWNLTTTFLGPPECDITLDLWEHLVG